MTSSNSSDAVETACNRLNQALGALESRIAELSRATSQSKQIADEGRQLLARHEALAASVRTLTEENKKLKHGIQNVELEKLGQKQRNGELFKHLESVISRIEEVVT